MNDHLFVKELIIRFTARASRKQFSQFVYMLLFSFVSQGGMWDYFDFINSWPSPIFVFHIITVKILALNPYFIQS